MPRLRLGFAGLPDSEEPHLSVDGMTAKGPNLSHWPGNRTPRAWKRDLSTSICLAYARASEAERRAFLSGAEVVLNDHYDTDGFGSLLAVLRPEIALAREEVLLAAAACGDFGVLTTRRSFAIDRTIKHLAAERSPLHGELSALEHAPRSLQRYRWLIEHAADLLDGRIEWPALWADELARIEQEMLLPIERRVHHALGVSVITSREELHRMTLNTRAAAYRVLHVRDARAGMLYRYHDRTESWFELVTIEAPARRDLRALAERLQDAEERAGRAAGLWCADAPTDPTPELYHGIPAPQEYGEVTRELTPSALSPQAVESALISWFEETQTWK